MERPSVKQYLGEVVFFVERTASLLRGEEKKSRKAGCFDDESR